MIKRSFPSSGLPLVLALLPACTPTPSGDDEVGVTTSPEGEDSDSSSSTESSTDSTTTDSSTEDATDFIREPDVPYQDCNIILQDCPEGEKCVAFSSSGGSSWDANKCAPVKGDQGVGEACVWDGFAAGTDDCDATSMCWNLVESDGAWTGTCAPYCTGTPDLPMCPDGYSCLLSGDSDLALCSKNCDPLLQDCNDGYACFWDGIAFQCVFTTDGVPSGQPCGYINDCAKGNLCADASVLPGCQGSACCVPYCDLLDPDCSALAGTECVAFFEMGMAPPGLEHIGVCIVP